MAHGLSAETYQNHHKSMGDASIKRTHEALHYPFDLLYALYGVRTQSAAAFEKLQIALGQAHDNLDQQQPCLSAVPPANIGTRVEDIRPC